MDNEQIGQFIKDVDERIELTNKIMKYLSHFPLHHQFYILTSKIHIDDLRKMVAVEEFIYENNKIADKE